MNTNALILVDIQNDFLPGGALAVPEGNQIITIANHLMHHFDTIVATQDWHPSHHASFVSNHPGRKLYDIVDLDGLSQVLWPVHCVQDSQGAEFPDTLDTNRITKVFRKGTDPEIDSYSGFYDNGRRKSTGLSEWLRSQDISEVTVCGLATDYCVKFTALDALQDGFRVNLYLPACRGVDLNPGDVEKAIAEMQHAGVRILS